MGARRALALGGLVASAGAIAWMRKNPTALPYGQRFFVQGYHPLITRERLVAILAPRAGERILEVGPGTGYYTLDVAEAVGPEGAVDILDVRQEFLDHTMREARERGLENVRATQADARELPYGNDEFDGAFLVTVLGEVPDQAAALRELRRVLKTGGRLVVGEFILDPHFVTPASLLERARAAGFELEQRSGPGFGYFARLRA